MVSMSLVSVATPLPLRGAPAAPLGMSLKALASAQLLHAERFLGREGDARHAGIHEARKCIRRARAVLALGKRSLDHRARRLDGELGRLCRGLSRLRDAHALLDALGRLEATAPFKVIEELPDAKYSARMRRDLLLEAALKRDPQFESRRRRLLAYRQRLERLNWQNLDDGVVARAIERSGRRAEKSCRRSFRHPDRDADWHAYRRRLRRLRQQDTLLAEIRPDLRPAIQGLEERATLLGEAQDDALLIRNCGRRSPFPAGQRALLRQLARERLKHARRLP